MNDFLYYACLFVLLIVSIIEIYKTYFNKDK